MQKTNLVPAIEERTVSGSSVSFNSAFALPLKACKVSFSATQSGSGDPSPSNPRAISGVSAIGLTANSTPVSVSFGNTKYGGELDLLTGVLTVTHKRSADISTLSWGRVTTSEWNCFYTTSLGDKKAGTTNIICEVAKTAYFYNMPSIDNAVMGNGVNVNCYIRDTSFNLDVNAFKQAYAGYYLYYELAEPITIQLSPTELSSIIGNNTFSTDTGTLEITFADLQEKSASGSVASFNTALAMPLASCNIAVNAWQEGSGDPSPVNVRPIHGFSEVNATRVGKNLFDYTSVTWENGYLDDNQEYHTSNVTHYSSPFPITPNTIITASGFSTGYSSNIYMLDKNKNWLGRLTAKYTTEHHFTTPQNCYYLQIQCQQSENGSNLQIEAGSTATAYEPYVTPTIYTKQLGETVYGGFYNSVSGVKSKTHEYILLDENYPNISLYNIGARHGISFGGALSQTSTYAQGISNMGKCNTTASTGNGNIWLGVNSKTIYWYDILDTLGLSTVDEFKAWLADNNLQVVASLPTPIETNIGSTPIFTNIGDNNIFCDTGDTSVVYKDLDIAKRGNFREVFRLPS